MTEKHARFFSHALLSSIVAVMIGFLALAVRAFTTAETARFVFFISFAALAVTLVMYFLFRRSIET
ncbi:MAG TPA: hypothetical protein VN822_09215 [Candidatus Acidoferrales bacterium]|nr:hypothetical protein [Candidatus Acidoferrales bacterium]